jgi:hypothetical protein
MSDSDDVVQRAVRLMMESAAHDDSIGNLMLQELPEDIYRILTRLDTEIPQAMKEMDALLARLRTPAHR